MDGPKWIRSRNWRCSETDLQKTVVFFVDFSRFKWWSLQDSASSSVCCPLTLIHPWHFPGPQNSPQRAQTAQPCLQRFYLAQVGEMKVEIVTLWLTFASTMSQWCHNDVWFCYLFHKNALNPPVTFPEAQVGSLVSAWHSLAMSVQFPSSHVCQANSWTNVLGSIQTKLQATLLRFRQQ